MITVKLGLYQGSQRMKERIVHAHYQIFCNISTSFRDISDQVGM